MPLLLLVLASCDPADVDADADGSPASEDCDDHDAAVHPGAREVAGNGIDDDCDPGSCIGVGFAEEAEEWALPSGYAGPGYPPFRYVTEYGSECGDYEWYSSHAVLDLTGDGLLDLVVLDACGDAEVGTTHWRVHAGGPGGFEDIPTEWALPASYATEESPALPYTESYPRCAYDESPDGYFLRDLTGDGRPDLVIISDCDDLSEVGTTYWRVHAATSDGFSDEGTEWALPAGYFDGGDPPFWDPGDRDGLAPEWTTGDFTGDGRPDLMVFQDGVDDTLSATSWRLHAAETDGFANVGATWSVPGAGYPGLSRPFYPYSYSTIGECGESSPPLFSWELLDDDDVPDLRVTRACDAAEVGATVWRVYLGGPDGFAESPEEWALPPTPTPEATPYLYSSSLACGYDRDGPAYFVEDFDGDRFSDLVLTGVCEAGSEVGATEWAVYRGGPGGFATEPTAWPLPSAYATAGSFPFESRTELDGSCDRPAYETFDLTGDGVPDLVMTKGCEGDGLGDTHWRVHPGVCDL